MPGNYLCMMLSHAARCAFAKGKGIGKHQRIHRTNNNCAIGKISVMQKDINILALYSTFSIFT